MRTLVVVAVSVLMVALGGRTPVGADGGAGFERCRSLSFGPGLGGYRISVRRTSCAAGRTLIRRWNATNKPGPTTRLGPWTCVADGPANTGAVERVRCRDGARRVAATPFGGP